MIAARHCAAAVFIEPAEAEGRVRVTRVGVLAEDRFGRRIVLQRIGGDAVAERLRGGGQRGKQEGDDKPGLAFPAVIVCHASTLSRTSPSLGPRG